VRKIRQEQQTVENLADFSFSNSNFIAKPDDYTEVISGWLQQFFFLLHSQAQTALS
jgi:hypothetical protein